MRTAIAATVLSLSVLGLAPAEHANAAIRKSISIPAQGLGPALQVFAKDLDLRVIFIAEDVSEQRTQGASGNLTAEEALSRILEGTGLTYRHLDATTVTIVPAASDDTTHASPSAESPASAEHDAAPAESSAAVLEEVMVTAQKRSENLQSVGISITAIGADMLEKNHMRSVGDLGSQIPNVSLDSDSATGTGINMSIRGIELGDFNDATEAPVALYVDEFYILPVSAGSFLMLDVDRVEALRGPQGTLFGRNANGGLLHLVTKRPEFDKVGVMLELEGGEHDLFSKKAILNVPISDTFAMRVAAAHEYNKGWVKNLRGNTPAGGGNDFRATRAQFGWRPTDRVNVNVKYERNDADAPHSSFQGTFLQTDAQGASYIPADPDPNSHRWNTPYLTRNVSDIYTGHVNVELSDALSFTSVTGYLDLDRRLNEDCDGLEADICRTEYRFETTEFTQELRLGYVGERTRWTTGLYYLKQEAESNPIASVLGYANGFTLEVRSNLDVEGKAAFGQVEYDVTDAITVIGGLRYSRDEKYFDQLLLPGLPGTITGPDELLNFSDSVAFTDPAVGFGALNFTANPVTLLINPLSGAGQVGVLPGVDAALLRRDDKLVNARLQFNWRLHDDAMLYASFNKGARSGGFNNGFILGVSAEGVPIDSDSVRAYEIGLKTQFDRFRINGAVFYNDYQDYHDSKFDNLGLRTGNIQAEFRGGEIEALWNPIEGFDIGLGYSRIEADLEGQEGNARAPWRFNGVANYAIPIGSGLLRANLNWLFVAEERSNNGSIFDTPEYNKINTQISYSLGRYELFAWGRNLSDDQPARANAPLLRIISKQEKRPPRWFGVGVRYSF